MNRIPIELIRSAAARPAVEPTGGQSAGYDPSPSGTVKLNRSPVDVQDLIVPFQPMEKQAEKSPD
jgi:hypothetical protein